MAINVTLSCDQVLGGVIGLSGHVFPSMLELLEQDKDGVFDEKKRNLRIFAYHGKADDLIDEGRAAKTYERIKNAGFK